MLLDFSKYRPEEIVDRFNKKDVDTPYLNDVILFLKKWISKDSDFSVFTSGSTGVPKEILFKRSSLITSAEISLKAFDLKLGNMALLCLPMNFVAAKLMLVRAIVGKLKLLVVEPSSNPLKGINQKFDFVAFTPHQISNILEENKMKIELISTLIIGGSKLSIQLEEKLKKLDVHVYETFGMSETLTHCALRDISSGERYFSIIKGFKCWLNEENCLLISASHLPQSPIITNDVVEMISKDTFKWLGRKDNVINSGGVKIYPEQIEKKLNTLFPFSIVVVKENDDKLGEKAIAFIEEKDRSRFDKNLLKRIAFDRYEKPKEFRFIDSFPRNPNGKIERRKFNA